MSTNWLSPIYDQKRVVLSFFMEAFQLLLGVGEHLVVSPYNHSRILNKMEKFETFVELGEVNDWHCVPQVLICDRLMCVNVDTETTSNNNLIEIVVLRFQYRGEVRIEGVWVPLIGVVNPEIVIMDERMELRGYRENGTRYQVTLNLTMKEVGDPD